MARLQPLVHETPDTPHGGASAAQLAYALAKLGRFSAEADNAGLTTLAALPLIRDGRLQAVAVWYF